LGCACAREAKKGNVAFVHVFVKDVVEMGGIAKLRGRIIIRRHRRIDLLYGFD